MNEKVSLIAPCGMNCSICMAFLRKKNRCNGCRAVNTWNPKTRVECKIKNCHTLTSEGFEYCCQCSHFPCVLISKMDRRYRTRYKMSLIENLNALERDGVEAFRRAENEKWKCKYCGGVINVHKAVCSHCEKAHELQ